MPSVYMDTCILIYYIERHPDWFQRIASRLFPAERPPSQPVVCDLVRMECRVLPMREDNTPLLRRYDNFFATPGLRHVALDASVFDLATELRARHRLKTPDALHLAAAIQGGCDEFWTNDQRLDAAASGHLRPVMP